MRAADRLHVAQSALSRQIMDLETELGVALFERQHRRVKLSEAGRLYLIEMKRVLRDIEQINMQTRRYADGQAGTLRVSLNNLAVRVPAVAHSLHQFRSDYAGVDLALSHMYAPDQMEALRSGLIDAAFILHPREDAEIGLDYCAIGEDKYILALPATNPLASRRDLYLADLKDEPFLWKQPGPAPDRLMQACLAAGFSPRIVQHLQRLELSPDLVAEGMGLAFVLSNTRYLDSNVVFRSVSDLNVSLQLDLMWKRDNPSIPLARFIEAVRQPLPDEAGVPVSAGQ